MAIYNVAMHNKILLIILLFGMLFPVAWISQQNQITGYWFDFLTPEWVHILTHAVLFAILAMLLLSIFGNNTYAQIKALVLAFLVGLLQEGIQMVAAAKTPGLNELFDLGVDLAGAIVGITIVLIMWKAHRGERKFSID